MSLISADFVTQLLPLSKHQVNRKDKIILITVFKKTTRKIRFQIRKL